MINFMLKFLVGSGIGVIMAIAVIAIVRYVEGKLMKRDQRAGLIKLWDADEHGKTRSYYFVNGGKHRFVVRSRQLALMFKASYTTNSSHDNSHHNNGHGPTTS